MYTHTGASSLVNLLLPAYVLFILLEIVVRPVCMSTQQTILCTHGVWQEVHCMSVHLFTCKRAECSHFYIVDFALKQGILQQMDVIM